MAWLITCLTLALAAVALLFQARRFSAERQRLLDAVEKLAAGKGARAEEKPAEPELAQLAERIEHFSDETRRHRDERERRDENFRTILASLADGVAVVDSRGLVRVANPALGSLFAVAGEPAGRELAGLIPGIDASALMTAALETGEAQSAELATGSGESRAFAVRAAPIRDAAGELCVVMIFRDMTRLRQLEEVRKQFVANVSHELRTPLSILRGYLENLQDSPDLPRADVEEMLAVMARHATRLEALLEDLLILARLEARADELEIEEIDAKDLLRELAGDWALKSRDRGVAIVVDAEPGLRPLLADHLRLGQVFSNLLDNAIKYTLAGGTVTLRACAAGEGIEFRIEDTGSGIPAGDVPHIFERFYRADKARARAVGGTGLGLSIVKHIVQRHGGEVRAESEVGKGTAVILRLPLVPPAIVEIEDDASAAIR